MKRKLTKILTLVMAMIMALAMAPAIAEDAPAAGPTAFLMYADSAWANQWWHDGAEPANGVKVTEAAVTGEGSYTVGLDFTGSPDGAATGLAFAAVGITDGEKTFPGYYIKIDAMRVNGEAIEVGKGYTSSDEGVVTRMNIYNEWVTELPVDARSYDGDVSNANWIIVNKDAFASVKTVEVDFTYMKHGQDIAYIGFSDSAWGSQWWHDGNDYGGVKATEAVITGAGDYTVGLDFTGTAAGGANGTAFSALMIHKGENTFPGYYLKINEIRIDGKPIEFKKGYTSSDDKITTRMNIYNEWVTALPEDARSYDGKTDDATWMMVDKAVFGEKVGTYEIDFSFIPKTDTAFLMYADTAWAVQAMNPGEVPDGVKATEVTLEGAGTYTVGLDFTGIEGGEIPGFAFIALGVGKGEINFPGYFLDITEIKVNGAPIEIGKDFTTTDENITTRVNIWNEWVTEIPAQARRADGDLEGATAILAPKEALANVKTIDVTFDYIYGKPVAVGEAPMTEDEKAAAIAADYKAYIGVQSETYIFRNAWDDSYGRDDAENPGFFGRLTGWDADSKAVDYGGTLVDADITKNGTYTVSLKTGEMGFGTDTKFNLLFVSTDIPSKAVKEGVITISDVKVKFGDGKTQDYTELVTTGNYARIMILDSYNQSAEPVAYTMPGANTPIEITFTVSGLAD